jgi:hypothetical protein
MIAVLQQYPTAMHVAKYICAMRSNVLCDMVDQGAEKMALGRRGVVCGFVCGAAERCAGSRGIPEESWDGGFLGDGVLSDGVLSDGVLSDGVRDGGSDGVRDDGVLWDGVLWDGVLWDGVLSRRGAGPRIPL